MATDLTHNTSNNTDGTGTAVSLAGPTVTDGDVLAIAVYTPYSTTSHGTPAYGGNDFTLVREDTYDGGRLSLWWLETDGTETGNITTTLGASTDWAIGYSLFDGAAADVKTAVTPTAHDDDSGGGTLSLGLTAQAGDVGFASAGSTNDESTYTPGGGLTERWDQNSSGYGFTGATEDGLSAGSTGHTLTFDDNTEHQGSAVLFRTSDPATPTAAGDKYVRRQSAARSNISNTATADFGYDTEVYDETGFGAWGSDEIAVDEAMRYLVIHGTGEVDDSGTSRAVGFNEIVVDGTGQGIHGATTHRYVRLSGGANEGVSLGAGIVDATAGTEAIGARVVNQLNGGDSVGDFDVAADAGGAIQIIALGTGNFLELERNTNLAIGDHDSNTTRPWLDSTPDADATKVTYDAENHDEGGWYPGSGGDITLPANKKFVISWAVQFHTTDSSRTNGFARLNINGENVQYGTAYHRNTSTQGPITQGLIFWETGGSAETLFIEAFNQSEGLDAGTVNVTDASLQIVELDDGAEWIHVDNSTTDSLTTALASTTTWYTTPLSATYRADGGSNLSLDAANDAVQNDSGDTLSVLAIGWLYWDRDAGSSGTRKVPTSTFAVNGTNVQYGWGGAFSRGAQSSDDTWAAAYMTAAAMDVAASADITLETRDQASSSNADMGVYASDHRHFIGVQVVDLATLAGSAGQSITPSVHDTGSFPTVVVTQSINPTDHDTGSFPATVATQGINPTDHDTGSFPTAAVGQSINPTAHTTGSFPTATVGQSITATVHDTGSFPAVSVGHGLTPSAHTTGSFPTATITQAITPAVHQTGTFSTTAIGQAITPSAHQTGSTPTVVVGLGINPTKHDTGTFHTVVLSQGQSITPSVFTGGTFPTAVVTHGINPTVHNTGSFPTVVVTHGITPAVYQTGTVPTAVLGQAITPSVSSGGITPTVVVALGINPSAHTSGAVYAVVVGQGITPANHATGATPGVTAGLGVNPVVLTGGSYPTVSVGYGIAPTVHTTGTFPAVVVTLGINPTVHTTGTFHTVVLTNVPPVAVEGGRVRIATAPHRIAIVGGTGRVRLITQSARVSPTMANGSVRMVDHGKVTP